MSRLVKIVDNKYVQIEEYKNPNICFNTNEYSDFEDYCILRETFDPFRMFYENKELKSELELYKNGVYFSSEVDEKDKQIDVLKKQVDEYQKELEKADNLTQICIFKGKEESETSYRKCLNILDKKEIQQKEFIKWLEDEINKLVKEYGNYVYDDYSEEKGKYDTYIEILQKYKSIIGLNNE